MKKNNLILDTDSYKASHWLQYPPGTTSMFSYIESRGGKYDRTCFFGLQYIIQEYLDECVTEADVAEAKEFFAVHGEPFNEEGWLYIVKECGGKLPVRIKAVPEGSVVPTGCPLVTVESTDPKAFWAVSWLETMLMRIWYPINVATIGWHIRKTIMQALEKSADNPAAEISFKLHDFGARGVSSRESAGIGGAAHLVNFMGSDTVVGVHTANRHYHSKMAAFSIPASEHSSITSWGKDSEVDAFRNMLTQFAKPGSIVACVSDSYDIYKACSDLWGTELRQQVIDSGATLVVRPDSGTPHIIVTSCLELLAQKFGCTVNSKGYKVLNNVRVIQGDGINHDSIKEILLWVMGAGFSASNVAFGMGGGLLQQHDRDTQKFAMKCSSITVNGEERDVFKDPCGDHTKRSKAGRLDLESFEGYRAKVLRDGEQKSPYSVLHTVYDRGVIMNGTTLDEVRERARKND